MILNRFLALLLITGLVSCADVSEEVEGGAPPVTNQSRSSNDMDGDGIPNSSDKEPDRAYLPRPEIIAKNFESAIELQVGDQISDFVLRKDEWSDNPEPIGGEPFFVHKARKAVGEFYLTGEPSTLEANIRNNNIFVFKSSELRDKARMKAYLYAETYDKLRDNSGSIEVSSGVRFSELSKTERISALSFSLYTISESGRLKKMKEFSVNGEITISTDIHPVEETVSEIHPGTLLRHETTANTFFGIGLNKFEYAHGKSLKRIEQVRKSTLELNVRDPQGIETIHIALTGQVSLRQILLKVFGDEVVINGKDFVLNGFGNNLPLETKPRELEDNQNGRWFIISNKASAGIEGVYSNGEAITFAYLTGEEIYKAISKDSIIEIQNSMDKTGNINITEANSVELLLQGKKRFGSKKVWTGTGLSWFATGGAPGHFRGHFNALVDETLYVVRDANGGDLPEDPFEIVKLKINESEHSLKDVSFSEDENDYANFKIFKLDENYIKKDITLNIFNGEKVENFARGFSQRTGWDANGNNQVRSGLSLGNSKVINKNIYNIFILTNSLKED